MPIYEYLCEKCSHEFEREQRITDDPVKTCPKCRGRKVKKLISQTSFVLKGGGWYSDLYSSSKKNGRGDGDKKDSSSSDKSDSSDSSSDKKESKSSDSKEASGDKKKKKASKKNAA